jgi:hypothetical protein
MQNSHDPLANLISKIKAALTKLRSQVFTRQTTQRSEVDDAGNPTGKLITSYRWRGGMWSLEITNEQRGWHVHLHLLVDCLFCDAVALSKIWGRLVGQDFAIVKVKDCRDSHYLHEVTKYTVEGNQFASWTPQQINEFVTASDGPKFFGVFGSLFKQRAEWTTFKSAQTTKASTCPCGCTSFKIFSEKEWEWHQLTSGTAPPCQDTPRQEPSFNFPIEVSNSSEPHLLAFKR